MHNTTTTILLDTKQHEGQIALYLNKYTASDVKPEVQQFFDCYTLDTKHYF